MLAAAIVAYIKIRSDAKTPQFVIFGTHVISLFYSVNMCLYNQAMEDVWFSVAGIE